jgi:hypothetical protein
MSVKFGGWERCAEGDEGRLSDVKIEGEGN